jgi:hypothetical protein
MTCGSSSGLPLAEFVEIRYTVFAAVPLWQQRGGVFMLEVYNFLAAVAASVAGNLVCKWLERFRKGS